MSSYAKPAALVPVTVNEPVVAEANEIRLDIRRGATVVQVAWPVTHVAMLGPWLKDLLR